MCTLTYFPTQESGFILTSNRDEAPNRKTLEPQIYSLDGGAYLFPKDQLAGGTWLAASEGKRIVSLLNGGFEPHVPDGPYRLSRGIVVLDVLQTSNLESTLQSYDLEGVEPFTMVIVDWSDQLRLMDLIWDGSQRHLTQHANAPKIWSSSLLYTQQMKMEREQWFDAFKNDLSTTDKHEILKFHHDAGKGNQEYGLIMDRGFVKTKSISQITVSDYLLFDYEALDEGRYRTRLDLSS